MLTIREFCEVNELTTYEVLEDGTREEYDNRRLTWTHGTDYVAYVTAAIKDERTRK